MLKVVLLILLMDGQTGELRGVYSPIPAFQTIEECVEAQATIPTPPPGLVVYAKCVEPSLVSI